MELGVVCLQKLFDVSSTSCIARLVKNGKSEAFADVVLGNTRNIENQTIRGAVSQLLIGRVNWIYQTTDRLGEVASAARNHWNLCNRDEI